MKTRYHIILSLITLTVSMGCNDIFLERFPKSSLSPETYFSTASELETYTNSFYSQNLENFQAFTSEYTLRFGDDVEPNTVATAYSGLRTTPASGGGWTWTALRNINFFLEHSSNCPSETAVKQYNSVAKFFRAYFYYNMMVRFGDLPWYDHVIGQSEEELLTKPRDSREIIFSHITEDLDYAIENASSTVDPTMISKWTAMAFKSRVCLFEGTFRKYRNLSGWEDILRQGADAAAKLMNAKVYSISKSGTASTAYANLFLNETPDPEFILAKRFKASLNITHYTNLHIQGPSQGHPSMTRALFNSYLNSDGTRFTDREDYATEDFYNSTQNRDPRLSQSIRTQGYTYPNSSSVLQPDFNSTTTGYQIRKFVTDVTTTNGSNAMPYIRYAEVLLNYAECKAELGTITQSDLDISIKLLRDRVNMPGLNLAEANSNPDPYLSSQYLNVNGSNKGIILEIRRERRVELFLEANFRWNDVLRWKEGHLFAEHPHGMYIAGPGEIDFDNDGTTDLVIYSGSEPVHEGSIQYANIASLNLTNGTSGEIVVSPSIKRVWDENKDYFYPIPLQDLQLNPNLVQNPGWDTQ